MLTEKHVKENTMETCQRCGEKGEDRRTLWMACLYAMHRLDVPFEQAAIRGRFAAMTGEKETFLGSQPVFEEVDPDAEPRNFPFYRLRVCKQCRGDWMGAIADWFRRKPRQEATGTEPGVEFMVQARGTEEEEDR